MATIDQRGKRSWRARVRRPGYKLKTRTFDTRAQAEIWAERIERELHIGNDTIPNVAAEPTLAEALERYEREITKDKKSHEQERRRVAQWCRRPLSKLKLSKLSPQHFVTFRNERINAGTKRSTVRLDLALISHLFTIARKEWGMGYLTNPITDVRQLKADKWRDRRLSAGEFERFERALDSGYNRVIAINIRFALETAARKGELLKLLWRDIDLKRRVMTLRDTKNGDDRRVPLTQKAIELLEQLPRGEGERVFRRVAGVARDEAKLAYLTKSEGGRDIRAYAADVSSSEDVLRVFDSVDRELGEPDLVVFNVGAFQKSNVLDIDPADFERCWRIGCLGGLLVGQAAARRMVKNGRGTIIFSGATAALRGSAGFANLAVPKFGLRALSQSMARELGPKGVHVGHVIIDGQIESERYRHLIKERGEDSFLAPDAIAELYLQLHRQPRSAWSHEIDVRPWSEKF